MLTVSMNAEKLLYFSYSLGLSYSSYKKELAVDPTKKSSRKNLKVFLALGLTPIPVQIVIRQLCWLTLLCNDLILLHVTSGYMVRKLGNLPYITYKDIKE